MPEELQWIGNKLDAKVLVALPWLALFIIIVGFAVYIYNYLRFVFLKDLKVKYINKPLNISIFVIYGFGAIFWILSMIFLYSKSFMEDNIALAFWLTISFITLSFAFGASFFVIGIIWGNVLGIGMDEELIYLVGETHKVNKIINVVSDSKTNSIYINYLVGERSLRKLKFQRKFVIGHVVETNVSILQHKIEEIDQLEWFKARQQEIKINLQKEMIENVSKQKASLEKPTDETKTKNKKTKTSKPKLEKENIVEENIEKEDIVEENIEKEDINE